jgi:hypothetical protein
MQLTLAAIIFGVASITSGTPLLDTRAVDPGLVPPFGVQSGLNPDGTGSCDGIIGSNGAPIKIPCSCPPNRDEFIRVRLYVPCLICSKLICLFEET